MLRALLGLGIVRWSSCSRKHRPAPRACAVVGMGAAVACYHPENAAQRDMGLFDPFAPAPLTRVWWCLCVSQVEREVANEERVLERQLETEVQSIETAFSKVLSLFKGK